MRNFLIGVLFVVVGVGVTNSFLYYTTKPLHIHYITVKPTINVVGYDEPFTEENLKRYIAELNFKYPDLVIGQIKHESDKYSSNIFKQNKNLFGMKWSSQRPRTCIGQDNSHAVYRSWKESVLDFALYEAKYLSRCKTKAEYLLRLQRHYAKDPAYFNKLVKLSNE